ncbi:MAG TPA: GMC family oxidoreductase [Terriglobales bacterium]|nr:GMC family oxidoreductase [Terriglobales bacterium]
MPVHETDVCIIGGGISSAMLALKLSELRPGVNITVVEAGKTFFDLPQRFQYRERAMQYGENPWPGDFLADQAAEGVISRTMALGGSALHWGGTCNRFSKEDLRLKSMYGLYVDWPMEWEELEKFYCEAERRLGVSGEPSPFAEDDRSQPYPMAAMPLTWNLEQLRAWGNKSGIPFQPTPQAKNTKPYDGRSQCMRCGTCEICPTGAKYSPDFTFQKLVKEKKVTIHDRTLVRKLVLDDKRPTVVAAEGSKMDKPTSAKNRQMWGTVTYRAKTFVVASGYAWSSHLLLLSENARYPNGLANSSGLVGKYMNGHRFMGFVTEVDADIYPGMNPDYGLISRQYFRCAADKPYVRHDLRIWENPDRHPLRLKDGSGKFLLGDELVKDWRERKRGTARVRAYIDVHPARESELTLDAAKKNRWGDPMPKIVHRLDEATQAREAATKEHVEGVFARMAEAAGTKIVGRFEGKYLDHPAGGCRMGTDAAESVTDSYGRTHDHENLFVVGSPTMPTAGCTNGTLTMVALTLRSAEEIAKGLK